jgi:hypothetical protein
VAASRDLRREAVKLLQRLPLMPLRILRLQRKARDILADWSGPLGKGLGGESWATIRDRAQNDSNAPLVVMATTVTGHLAAVQFDALMAVALTLRGVRVSFVGCDAALPACMADQHTFYPDRKRFFKGLDRDVCKTCYPVGLPYLQRLGLPIIRLGGLIGAGDRELVRAEVGALKADGIAEHRFRDLPVGEHALAGALRFHARADLDGVPEGERVLRRYLEASCLTAIAADALAERHPYDVLVAHHGIYVPQGLWVAGAHKAGRRVVTWNPGYRRDSFVLSHDDTYHRTMITEPTGVWTDEPLGTEQRDKVLAYLDERRSGGGDWISFGSGERSVFRECLDRLGLDAGKPTIVALTSVTWDAQLHYESNAFASQAAWVDATIEAFRGRNDVNLVFRIHPAELTGNIPSEQRLSDHIAAKWPDLPPHVAVVPADDLMNTYALIEGADSALIYSTKTGVEIASRGIPVVVAGEAWIRGKGFSIDATSPEHYRDIVAALPARARLPEAQRERALRYANHFFFRRMVPLPGFSVRKGWPPYRAAVTDLAELAPGANANLEMACDAIVGGAPFLAR